MHAKHFLRFIFVAVFLFWSARAVAQKDAPPATPVPETVVATKPPPPTEDKPTSPPTPVPPTAVPATSVPPTSVPQAPVAPTALPPSATPTAFPTSRPTTPALTATRIPETPTPSVTPEAQVSPATSEPSATLNPTTQVTREAVPTKTSSAPSPVEASAFVSSSTRFPVWGYGLILAGAVFACWLVARFVIYTRQDLVMKRQMIAEDAATRLAAHRRALEALLAGNAQAWQRVVAQLLSDVLSKPVSIGAVPTVDGQVGYFSVTTADNAVYWFTPVPEKLRQLKVVPRPAREVPLLDEAGVEAQAVWQHLADVYARGVALAIPRSAQWALLMEG